MTAELTAAPTQDAAHDLALRRDSVPGPHPLDPLSAEEMRLATRILRQEQDLGPRVRFVVMTLEEPAKPAGLVFDPASPPDRRAAVVLWDRDAKVLTEAVVSLTTLEVLRFEQVPDRFPAFLQDDFFAVEDLVRADPRWQAAVRARGVTDLSLTMIDGWPSGYTGPEDDPASAPRLCRPLTFVRTAPGEHGYARPIEGLIVTVDMDALAVVDVADHGTVAIPPKAGNYDPEFMFDPDNRPAFTAFRDDQKPIRITQPEGPSYTVDGWGVSWQKWSFRVGFTPREGLVLHQVAYDDRGTRRPVLWRASLSEMVVPYGDTAPTHWNKNVFDEGEVGMGFSANSLTLGCDCVGHITYFDGLVNNADGEPVQITNAVCMHEEDHGIAWKHTDFRTGAVQVRRSRRLVISSIATVGNYEYGFFWYLYTDGSIEYEVKLTGVLTTGALEEGQTPLYGVVVAPGLYGPNHQHFFNVRLDMTVDGPDNTVVEVDSVPVPVGPDNPRANAWAAEHTVLETELGGRRDVNRASARFWKVVNSGKVNELGQPVAYELVPGASVPPMFQEGSAIYDRARFVQHDLWVTKADPAQLYAAGDYPYQSRQVQGLPEYVADDASIVDTDVVLWYTVGAHHIVRPEDWPVMPVNHAGFHLKPYGFFDGNPALDVPPSEPVGHTAGHGEAADGAAGCHCG
jgi:primary-amine oxidase